MVVLTPEQRFWNQVKKSRRGCWNWTGHSCRGYGRIRVSGKIQKASRFSYQLHYGPIPEGVWVLHKCDNKLCVNPEHLELGDAKKNTQDAVNRGCIKPMRGEKHPLSKLTQKQVDEIKANPLSTQRELAIKYGVSSQLIGSIRRGKLWKT